MPDQTIACGSTESLIANGFSKTGWIFSGWADTSGGNIAYANQASYTMGFSNLILYAVWIATTDIVTFDSQDADVEASPNSITVTYPATFVSSLPIAPIKTGYAFSGWFTAIAGGGTEFTKNTEVVGDITVYAYWIISYAIGDLDPSGIGKVFYISDDGIHGLEAAPSDQGYDQSWIEGGGYADYP